MEQELILWLGQIQAEDSLIVGGKNSSLARLIRRLQKQGISVPNGYATTAFAYRTFMDENGLEGPVSQSIKKLKKDGSNLSQVGKTVRSLIMKGKFSPGFEQLLIKYFNELKNQSSRNHFSVAVRSSANAEDSPEASFAGQLESFLNISTSDELLMAIKKCYASLYTDRAIFYRIEKGLDHMKLAISVGIQEMVRSDKACSGVMFSLDMETGFPHVVAINGSWGLGEYVVKGSINPDQFTVFKPLLNKTQLWPIIEKKLGDKKQKLIYGKKNATLNKKTSQSEQTSFILSDEEVLQLARWACLIEDEYGMPMDMEWGKDGEDQKIYILQARPETVHSTRSIQSITTFNLNTQEEPILVGTPVGQGIGQGKAQVLESMKEASRFQEGSVLVAKMTDPDWVPLMKKASAIITESGGSTSHAAIVSRELGVPAVIGVSHATRLIHQNDELTVSCAQDGEGRIYKGLLEFDKEEIEITHLPRTETDIMINVASPGGAMNWWKLPVKGIGLTRIEFLISHEIKIHPMALVYPEMITDKKQRKSMQELLINYEGGEHYFVEKLAQGMGKIAASQYPHPVIIRTSDFKTNEYAQLLGGEYFEPHEENPMLGFRGASRYYHPSYLEGFALESLAFKYAREVMGFENIIVMIPFCRTPEEADKILHTMAENGLVRGENGLEIYMMAEIPSNVFLAKEFALRFDGFSIGSNDLTQLVLGVDRDSSLLEGLFRADHPAVKKAIKILIEQAHEAGIKIGICGQAPSDNPEFARFLIECGIDSISLNPDSVLKVLYQIGQLEKKDNHELGSEQRFETFH